MIEVDSIPLAGVSRLHGIELRQSVHMHPSLRNIAAQPSRHSARSALCLVLFLVLSLLFSQWLGYSHAINHAGLKSETLTSQSTQPGSAVSSFDHQKASNACASLDAATLGAGLHTPAYVLLLSISPAIFADSRLQHCWLQPFTALFSSRAPPPLH